MWDLAVWLAFGPGFQDFRLRPSACPPKISGFPRFRLRPSVCTPESADVQDLRIPTVFFVYGHTKAAQVRQPSQQLILATEPGFFFCLDKKVVHIHFCGSADCFFAPRIPWQCDNSIHLP